MDEQEIVVGNSQNISVSMGSTATDINVSSSISGVKGDQGEKGDIGASNVLTIGTVVGGETAGATITGTSPEQVLNLVLPKGDKGDKGDTGAKGYQGIQGFQGLKGDKGDKGEKGDTGATGATGATGSPGAKGDKGDKGDTGAQGLKGDKGDTGATGATGAKGDKGDTGAGVVVGGTTGQVLAKKSNSNYDTEWVDQSTGTIDHAGLSNLDYASSGHTGFAPALGADDNYVTDAEKAGLQNRFNGVVSTPTVTDNGNGTVTLGSGDYCLSSVTSGSGIITKYTLAGGVLSLTDGAQNYIVADYNSGSPLVKVITDVSLINETTIVPIYSIYRNGNYLHTQNWDTLGLALANKVHQSIVKTQRYRRESGLAISESGTRNVNLTGGIVWTGAVPITLDAVASATDSIFFWYHVGGVWTQSVVTQYNNAQYDNGTNLVSLSGPGTQYAVNWIFRGVESQKHLYMVLGTTNANLAQAQAATVPALPTAITSHAVLVGKIIVAETASTATSIQSAFDSQFSYSSVASHTDLTNLDFASSGHTGDLTLGSETAGNKLNVNSTLGTEMVPSFASGNWTATNGWAANTTTITKTDNATQGTITPSGTFNVIAGRTYKAVVSVSAVTGGFSVTIGGVASGNIVSTGNSTLYITAVTTGKLILTASSGTTCTITAISVKDQINNTGNVNLNGDLYLGGQIRGAGGTSGVSVDNLGNLRTGAIYASSSLISSGSLSGTSLSLAGGISGATTVASSGANTNSIASLTTTPSDSYVAQCVTAALVGTPVRISPSVVLAGTAWNTTPTAASKVNAMQMYCLPTTGATTAPQWIWANKTVNGAANATELMRLTNTGNLTVTGTAITPIKGTGTLDSYIQSNIQNLSTGTSASSDIVATCNDGNETTNFVNMGINGSGYSNAGWTISGARDAYLYASNHTLTVGTSTAAKDVVIHTGGTLAANERVRVSDTAVTISKPIELGHASDTTITRVSAGVVAIEGQNIITASTILNLTYPVGAIYQSAVSTSPAALFGGTWSAMENRFLVGKGSGTFATAGGTGGTETVTLTAAQSGLPAHTHTFSVNGVPPTATAGKAAIGNASAVDAVTTNSNTTANASEAHNNLPPYEIVYMWKRTA